MPISRRLNRDASPLHKPEAYSRLQEIATTCSLKIIALNDVAGIVDDVTIAMED